MHEKVFKVRTAYTLPYGIKNWHLLVDLVLAMVVLQLGKQLIPGKLGSILGFLGAGGALFLAQVVLFSVDSKLPGKTLSQYFAWLNEADYYVPVRDERTPPVRP